MGVLMPSSFFTKPGVPTRGLRSAEGYEAETGVCSAGNLGLLMSLDFLSPSHSSSTLSFLSSLVLISVDINVLLAISTCQV